MLRFSMTPKPPLIMNFFLHFLAFDIASSSQRPRHCIVIHARSLRSHPCCGVNAQLIGDVDFSFLFRMTMYERAIENLIIMRLKVT